MSRTWVVNASPLILLGRIGRTELLPRLCSELIIPAGVARELRRGPTDDPARKWIEQAGRAHVRPVRRVAPAVAGWDLGLGET